MTWQTRGNSFTVAVCLMQLQPMIMSISYRMEWVQVNENKEPMCWQ